MKFAAIFLLIAFAGCQQEQTPTLFTGTAMTIDYRILVGAPLTPSEKREIEKKIQNVFEEVHTTYDKFNPDSELSRLNQLKAHVVVSICKKMHTLLLK
jgi:thiamine biosynthesis lipoprotein